ncbi:MAG: M56 family metallopeptidase, partial [Planctomycetota bacterium]
IYLPGTFSQTNGDKDRRGVLGHELSHVMRYDAAVNLLQIIAQAVYWFHPLVWWANKKIREEREKCCDEMAIARLNTRPKDYGKAIVNTLIAEHRRARPVPSLAVAGPVKNVEDRMKTIMRAGRKFYRRPTFITVVTVLFLAAAAVPTTLALTRRSAEEQANIEQALLEGFRANRDKFQCGVLAWISRRTGYHPAVEDNLELAGTFELWWDGDKIATRYAQDTVCTDPTGRAWIEKHEGGGSYDASVFSRRPKFDYELDWFQITRWGGQVPLDQQILGLKKLENISTDWDVVEDDAQKWVRLTRRNLNKEDVDYGAYSVQYFDPAKGYGLVREEHYNADGTIRLKRTEKLREVVPGGWFPVEISLVSGNAHSEQRYVLDISRCSFNDRSAIPEGIFQSANKRRAGVTEKLQEFCKTRPVGRLDASDEQRHLAGEALDSFISLALAGEYQKAAEFAHAEFPPSQIRDLREITQSQDFRILAVYVDHWSALAVGSVITANSRQEGPLVFHLVKVVSDGNVHWLIDDIDLETSEKAEQDIARFLQKHPEAEIIEGNSGNRVESAKKLQELGKAVLVYANDDEQNSFPDTLDQLLRGDYIGQKDLKWSSENVEYLAKGRTAAGPPDMVLAYDKSLLLRGVGTNVLFNDSHVEFVKPERLEKLGISAFGRRGTGDWRKAFYEVYRLEEGQVLKRIAPPFIPERAEYYRHEERSQASAVPEPPDYFTFHWDGKLKPWGLGFTNGKAPLEAVLRHNLNMGRDTFEGPEELLEIQVPGDWIVRKHSGAGGQANVPAA